MWNSAEPLSPSSWLKRARPDEPVRGRGRGSPWPASPGPSDARLEEALDLVGPHRAVLVARQAGDLGVARTSAGRRAGSPARAGAGRPRSPSSRLREPAPMEPSRRHGIPSPAMRRWSEVAERVAATTRTSEKTGLLADYLRDPAARRAADRGRLPDRAGRSRRRPARRPASAGRRSPAPSRTLAGRRPSGARRGLRPLSDLGPRGRRRADAGRATRRTRPTAPTLPEVAAAFAAIEAASGPARRPRSSATLLARCDPLTAKYIVKVLGGELRIGLREGLLEAAIAKAFDRPLDAVKRAGHADRRRRPDRRCWPATTASATAELALFHPLKFMLASPAEDAAEIIARLGPDGLGRGQVRRDPGPAPQRGRRGPALLPRPARRERPVPGGGRRRRGDLPWDGILDGELLAWRDGVVLPFLPLQARLGRKTPSAGDPGRGPGDLRRLRRPRRWAPGGDGAGRAAARACRSTERRGGSRRWTCPLAGDGGALRALAPRGRVDSVDELEAAFAEARARRNEGLMVKDPTSGYSPGRRGLGWLKMKKALATLDCVVVGVEVGHGKRHGVLSRLHVRGPRRRATARWSRSARPTAA